MICADQIRCEIPDALIDELRQHIAQRNIQAGLSLLASRADILEHFDGDAPNAAQFLGYLAQWVDIGYADIAVVTDLLSRIPSQRRALLPVTGYLHVQMAEGLVAMLEEEQGRAIPRFETVLLLAAEIGDSEIAAIANFWKARCHRGRGEYDAAFAHTVRARDLALACGHPRMAAVIRVLESWLQFQRSKHREALATLQEAESVLAAADDYVTLGNIQSTYGRIYRQENRLEAAVERFTRAIEEYRKRDAHHNNLARTLANIAYVQRLMALQLRKRMDAETARRRGAGAASRAVPGGTGAEFRERFETLRQQAFAHLDEAAEIYRLHHNHRGSGTVNLHSGFLHYDNGELDRAAACAERAYSFGNEKDDSILKARARILECMVENAKLEEGVDEDLNPQQHAQAALDHARDAVELARHTQNQRLLGRAFTWHGLTLANEFFGSIDAARELMHQAEIYIQSDFHDTAWEDLEMLKQRVLQSTRVHHALQAWSMGMVGDKTLQQITEDFAAVIIPKVWELEGKKISRVAARLSVSPKKVRRILIRAGLMGARKSASTSGGD